ncbi:cysteine ABC transporter substrate-binding protein [Streptococcus sciuri]|uniref:Cysteine ABC transporter substrate-binding protein n=1 Tax=Streptococcus sciuri TaxID=2973939 RepID=A0ABT2F7T2_9STRE|nr:cysteine ABC transporter substrate-binding protein [Streptococcus sciuri]MCS4488523.1 cysteine ABC transporter substrate-binding protein [Streptococcus sciuri]
MKTLHKITTFLSVLLFAVLLGACSQQSSNDNTSQASGTARSLEEIKKSGKVTIGVFSDKKPFGYVDENGDYQGYDVYFGNQLGKELGVKVKYVPVDAASRAEYLVSGKVDIILANFTVTKERAQQVDFALPYMKVSLGVVSPKKELITKVDQLKGKKLIVSKGTTAETYFSKHYPDIELVKFDQYSDAYAALLDGRGDAFSTDNTEVLAWSLENKGYEVGITSLGDVETIAPAVQKGNKELRSFINKTIKKLGKENFFHKDFDETLKPIYGDSAKPDEIVVEGGQVKK